jgi:hypothetical protein
MFGMTKNKSNLFILILNLGLMKIRLGSGSGFKI